VKLLDLTPSLDEAQDQQSELSVASTSTRATRSSSTEQDGGRAHPLLVGWLAVELRALLATAHALGHGRSAACLHGSIAPEAPKEPAGAPQVPC
tara:strand:+ start:927 stop:1208 length:282 start_codon:yes stop_codon:yes gene_type:complete